MVSYKLKLFAIVLHRDSVPIALETVDIIINPLERHGHVQQSIIPRRVMITGAQEPESSKSIVDAYNDDSTPSSKLMARKVIAWTVSELAIVNVKHDREKLWLTRFDLENEIDSVRSCYPHQPIMSYRRGVNVHVETIFVHQRCISCRTNISHWLGTDRRPVNRIVTLPTSVRTWRLKHETAFMQKWNFVQFL